MVTQSFFTEFISCKDIFGLAIIGNFYNWVKREGKSSKLEIEREALGYREEERKKNIC